MNSLIRRVYPTDNGNIRLEADQMEKYPPIIQSWNEILKAAGVKIKDFPPSVQSIAKRAGKGGEVFSVNPIVDAYNAITMELALPFGDLFEMGRQAGGGIADQESG